MNVKKKFYRLVILLGLMIIMCSGCNKTQTSSELYDDTELSQEEMEQSHIQLNLLEYLSVDADVTPYTDYSEGLSSYYTKDYEDENNIKTISKNNVKIFRQEPETILQQMEQYMSVSWNRKSLHASYDQATRTANFNITSKKSKGEEEKQIECWWGPQKGDITKGLEFNMENVGLGDKDEYFGSQIMRYTPEYSHESLSFGDSQKVGDKLRYMLESVIGQKINKAYTCVPVSKENYDAYVEQNDVSPMGLDSVSKDNFKKEFYYYEFFRDVDGFPWKYINGYSLDVSDDVKYAEDVADQQTDDEIPTTNEWPLTINYTENGITRMELGCFQEISDVYKDKQKVLNLSEIMKKIKDKFEEDFSLLPITIEDIKLCYASGFSDSEDGEIRNIVTPYWYVGYWDHSKLYQTMVFDAYTGRFISDT